MDDRTCSVTGCDSPHLARTWCGKHYARWLRNGSVADPAKVQKLCLVGGCDRRADARGMCGMHYSRWRLTGSTNARPRTRKPKKRCTVAECQGLVQARGWCPGHYWRWRKYGDPLGGVRIDDPTERFWSHVNKNAAVPSHQPELGPCWEWTGAVSVKGYGRGGSATQTWAAHRTSWIMAHGPIADGLWVLHRCDNPPCVNPDHLFLGTAKDNTDDMVSKGRQRFTALPLRLSDDQIREIRARYLKHDRRHGVAALAREFAVPGTEILKVLAHSGS